jgi:hypothetical protein
MRRRIVKGLALLAAVAALAVGVRIDATLKRPAGPGYVPENAQWVAAARDFPAFWAGLRASDSYERLSENWHPLRDFELQTRFATGIRPTPARWRLWLGRAILAGGYGGEYGLCARPGVLLRVAHALHAPFGKAGDGIYRFRSLYYAWRDGFLIASHSEDYVRRCLEAPPRRINAPKTADELRIEWSKPLRARVDLRGADGIPVRGSVRGAATNRDAPLTLAGVAGPEALVQASGSRPSDVMALWDLFQRALDGMPVGSEARRLLPEPGAASMPNPQAPVDEAACAVLAPTQEGRVRFETLWFLKPGSAGAVGLGAVEGAVTAETGTGIVVAGSPELAERFAAQELPEAADVKADLSLRVNWEPAAAAAEQHIRQLAEAGAFPKRDPQEVEMDFVPPLRGLGALGTLTLTGRVEGQAILFEGHLAEAIPGTP